MIFCQFFSKGNNFLDFIFAYNFVIFIKAVNRMSVLPLCKNDSKKNESVPNNIEFLLLIIFVACLFLLMFMYKMVVCRL